MISDNEPPFSSELAAFMREWEIKHNTIYPHDGKIESAVNTVKKLLKRCGSTAGESRNLALLNIRNRPTPGADRSPA